MATRTLLAGLALASGVLSGLLSGTALAETLRLRAEAVVEGEQVQLGHLIEGLEKGGDIPLFRAPAPGARGTIRADRVVAAAREMGIQGIDTAGLRVVSISRPGRMVTRADMQTLLGRALADRGAKGDLDVIIDDHFTGRAVDNSNMDSLRVISLLRDPATGRFEARVALAGAAASDSWVVTGAVVETREIAVPVADFDRGDALQAKDLVMVRRPAHVVRADSITSMSELVGMIPRRVLKAGEPIRSADLAKPILVEKNQLVSVVYASKGLSLSMRGRAQSNGAMGETIKVQNPQSKRIVEATVSGPQQVTVVAPPAAPANLAEAAPAARR